MLLMSMFRAFVRGRMAAAGSGFTYPFVTSSNSSGVGVSSGSGVPGRSVTKVIGVLKAYCTRVGGGPFPTEQDNAIGQQIRQRGNEYGTVTRRPRRCGWFDAPLLRYTAMINGFDSLIITKLDVLDSFAEIPVCTGYRLNGKETAEMPATTEAMPTGPALSCYLTARQVARELGLTIGRIHQLIRAGRIQATRWAGHWAVLPADVEAYAATDRHPGGRRRDRSIEDAITTCKLS